MSETRALLDECIRLAARLQHVERLGDVGLQPLLDVLHDAMKAKENELTEAMMKLESDELCALIDLILGPPGQRASGISEPSLSRTLDQCCAT